MFITLQCNFLTGTCLAFFVCLKQAFLFQVVALVHTLMTHKDINMRCVLVVAPLNTVLNWQVEFEKWLAVDDRLEVTLCCFDIHAVNCAICFHVFLESSLRN